ncbi:MAG: cellulose biosynthesis protein BcsN [Mesorhizobium sp.]|nr:cellulose biosynthesis protein BcsN [Mesorhizobium sp.]MBL8576474.1 cellulose biosynthesis protein BcsN [Mesorhizobium sp.]
MVAVALLAGCSKGMPLRSDDQTTIVPAEQAFALPEVGGPAVTAVLQTRYSNATQQDVLLANSAGTSGQNMLRIQIFGPVETSLGGGKGLRPGYLPAKNVQAEMRELFPGVRMRTSSYFVQNKYGAFGYAVGRTSGGDTCFYGWQRITSTGFAQTWIGNKGSIQVRLRLCDETASEQRLLQSMYGYTISASFKDRNWNPFGEPLPPDETLGRPGAPIYPISASRFETVSEEPQPTRQAAARTASSSSTAQQTPAQLPAPVGPVVPPPPGDSVASSAAGAAASRQTVPLVPAPPCQPGAAQTACN